MNSGWRAGCIAVALVGLPVLACAQPADLPVPPASTDQFPPGVKVIRPASGPVYANKRGQVLYGLDMRTVLRWSADAALYCQAECAAEWEPLLAPADATVNIRFPPGFAGRRVLPDPRFIANQSAPDWTVIAGPQGPQWVYKGWHMVYTRRASKRGDVSLDGRGDLTWNTLKFVPPVPTIMAPPEVTVTFLAGAYALTDKAGRVLVTGECAECQPLAAPIASKGIGNWRAVLARDWPQWAWNGKPVFAVTLDQVPKGATILRPEAGS
jgi:predicted lipoprotein with Yx(FWY)xxD motif